MLLPPTSGASFSALTCDETEKPRSALCAAGLPRLRRRRPATLATDAVPLAWLARKQPNPPTRRLARWEVALRLHARHAVRAGLVNDYRLSALAAARVFRDRNGSLTTEPAQAELWMPI